MCDCATSCPAAAALCQVGHTIQDKGINEACGGKVLRVDVGLSKGCGNGAVQVLEILSDGQQVVRLQEGLDPQFIKGGQHHQQQQQRGQQPEQGLAQKQQGQRQPQQQVPPVGGGVLGWLPEALRSLWQEQRQQQGSVQQPGAHQGGRTQQVEPTPA